VSPNGPIVTISCGVNARASALGRAGEFAVAHARPHQKPAFGAWCLRASSLDPKRVLALLARLALARSSSHAGNTSSNLAGVTAIREPGFGRVSSI
jgi:hypothetical protein